MPLKRRTLKRIFNIGSSKLLVRGKVISRTFASKITIDSRNTNKKMD
jgi:hypothetical protein